jgi:hypothetical protein
MHHGLRPSQKQQHEGRVSRTSRSTTEQEAEGADKQEAHGSWLAAMGICSHCSDDMALPFSVLLHTVEGFADSLVETSADKENL